MTFARAGYERPRMWKRIRDALKRAPSSPSSGADGGRDVLPQLWHWGEVEVAPPERRLGRTRLGPFAIGFTRLQSSDKYSEAWELLDVAGLPLGFERTLETAKANLRERGKLAWERCDVGARLSANGDDFDAVRLLWGARELELENPVALAPDRSTLVVAEADDLDAVAEALDIAIQAYQDKEATSRKLSLTPLVWRDGEWRLTMPSEISQDLRKYDLVIQALEFFDWYLAFQKARDGLSAPVDESSDLRYGFDDRTTTSFWIEGQSYLFQADAVRFYQPISARRVPPGFVFLGSAAWDDVIEAIPEGLIEREDTWPPTFRVARFPTQAERKELGLLVG